MCVVGVGPFHMLISPLWMSELHWEGSSPLECLNPEMCCVAGAGGLREEPQFVTARAGESVILRCNVVHPLTAHPPPYVVEWFKFGVPIPIFIKFGFYPPHVDPEYAGNCLWDCYYLYTACYMSQGYNVI